MEAYKEEAEGICALIKTFVKFKNKILVLYSVALFAIGSAPHTLKIQKHNLTRSCHTRHKIHSEGLLLTLVSL